MDIISGKFALFAIASVIIYYLLNKKYRIGYLTILSCGFIASFNYLLLPYILIYTLFNYFIGLRIPDSTNKKVLYRIGIIVNLTQLVFLKYASFSIDPIFELFDSSIQVSKISEIIVPLGISYFTLQGIGYLINIKMGWEKPEKKFIDFLLYITFFPKFLSGPIERSNHFLPQIKGDSFFNEKQVTEGLRIILIGLFKKIAIANQLAPYILNTHENVNLFDGYSLWLVLLSQALYLYFDFSGYTDIAIGLSKIFGINILPNFHRPFFAESVTDFWKRFHMSLSSWFNDYVFRQTSFRRRKWGVWASIYAVFITWVLFGIWHGAGWNFMILGFVQAVAIIYEYFTKRWRTSLFSRMPDIIRMWIGRFFTYIFYSGSLVFFFSPNIKTSISFYLGLTNFSGPLMIDDLSLKPFQLLIYIPVILIIELIQNDYRDFYRKIDSFWIGEGAVNRVFRWTVYSLMITIMFVSGFKAQQFVYANF